MAFSLIPNMMTASIYTLDLDFLKDRGTKVIFADLDNTLARYSERRANQRLRRWLQDVQAAGFRVFVISNSRKSRRAIEFCEDAGIPYIRHAGKPKRKGFRRAMNMCRVEPREAVMVGDQIFTDILGGNRSEIFSILVKPLANDTLFRKLRYAIEAPMRALCPIKVRWI